eukprot:c11465_g1_i2.p1 GENE.c11465_g1_i2~~c11465_g1_i2.p1  ORF type:complete len:443 (-),score=106.08 c11465_g1_i2:120-1448(-)
MADGISSTSTPTSTPTSTSVDFSIKLCEGTQVLSRNPIRELATKCRETGGISLSGGRPPKSTFPIGGLRVVGAEGEDICSIDLDDDALNYGPVMSSGYSPLVKWVTNFIKNQHNPPNTNWSCMVTSGNTDTVNKMVWLLSNSGDVVLTEEFSYPGAMMIARPQGREVVGVKMDDQGILPSALEHTCTELRRQGKKATILYLVTVGQNPTGIIYTPERLQQVYDMACKLDLIIVEDDPYYFVQLKSSDPEKCPGLKVNTATFLSVDTQGRVVRLDSFSKIIAPAFRLGFVTLHKDLATKLNVLNEITTLALSGIGQAVLVGMLTSWGDEGLDKQLRKVQATYTEMRDNLVRAFRVHANDLVEFAAPEAGMFIWIRVKNVQNTTPLVDYLFEQKVAIVPGSAFTPEGRGCEYMRCSFTQCTADMAEEAVIRIVAAIQHYLQRPQ